MRSQSKKLLNAHREHGPIFRRVIERMTGADRRFEPGWRLVIKTSRQVPRQEVRQRLVEVSRGDVRQAGASHDERRQPGRGVERKRRIAQIAQEKSSPGGSAQRVMSGLLYGADNAYGKPASGDDMK